MAARESRQAEQKLDALLAQIEVARREEGGLEASIGKKREELQTLRNDIQTEEEEWGERKQALLQESEHLTKLQLQQKRKPIDLCKRRQSV